MSKREVVIDQRVIRRFVVADRVVRGALRRKEAAKMLKVSVRQLQRIVKRYREQGAFGPASRRYGRTPGNKIPAQVRRDVMALVRKRCHDFLPGPAAEYLVEEHGCQASAETVRQWMIADGLWKPRPRRAKRKHLPRARRKFWGELIQIDGSLHDWFEGRAPICTLLVFVDDATSAGTALRFAPAETTRAYMETLAEHLEEHGRPVALYSDKHSVFRVNLPGREGEPAQFTRALKTLDIASIHANTPQAKGRVERIIQTLQNRLVKTMRLKGISSIEEANAWLPDYAAKYNKRCAKTPEVPGNAHRSVPYDPETPALILCPHHERALSRDLTFQLHHRQYQVQTPGKGYGLRGAKVAVFEGWDGNVTVMYRSKVRPVRLLAEGEPPIPLDDRKSLHLRVDQAKAEQAKRPRWKPAPDHP